MFYDLTMWNLLFPSRKNLEIGLGLVNVLSLDEFKAVIAHEFGHFSQKSMRVGTWVYLSRLHPPPTRRTTQWRVFRAGIAEAPRMWSTHPPNHEREDNARRRYIPSTLDDRSAWMLFCGG